MLIRFSAQNHKSIKSEQELSFVGSSLKEGDRYLLRTGYPDIDLVPCLAIYGANASGKSNILHALRHMCLTVERSYRHLAPTEKIPRVRFLLDEKYRDAATTYDCEFICDKIRYRFGFSYTADHIHREWLYAFPQGRRQLWYQRTSTSKTTKCEFGRHLKGRNSSVEETTRPNCLFLSAAAQGNHKQLGRIYEYLTSNITFDEVDLMVESEIAKLLQSASSRERVFRFLSGADFGIVDAKTRKVPATKKALEFGQQFAELLKAHFDPATVPSGFPDRDVIEFGHKTTGKSPQFIDFKRESAGTRRLLELLVGVISSLDKGKLLVVDELDKSLHTLLAMRILEHYADKKLNTNRAQLLFTTHDTNLLCSGLLKRDEIWFTEKSNDGSTHLYPLTDFHARKSENLEKGYLQGRFGAIPFLSPLGVLMPTEKRHAKKKMGNERSKPQKKASH